MMRVSAISVFLLATACSAPPAGVPAGPTAAPGLHDEELPHHAPKKTPSSEDRAAPAIETITKMQLRVDEMTNRVNKHLYGKRDHDPPQDDAQHQDHF